MSSYKLPQKYRAYHLLKVRVHELWSTGAVAYHRVHQQPGEGFDTDNLKIVDITSTPDLQAEDVLVKIHAVSLNVSYTQLRDAIEIKLKVSMPGSIEISISPEESTVVDCLFPSK